MVARNIRRALALVCAIVLTLGLIAHGFGELGLQAKSGVVSAGEIADMSMDGMSMPGDMPGKCDGCAGHEKGMAPAACAAFCGMVTNTVAAVVDLVVTPGEPFGPPFQAVVRGHADPPDPYPPRATILS
jgi:hypothetical protein